MARLAQDLLNTLQAETGDIDIKSMAQVAISWAIASKPHQLPDVGVFHKRNIPLMLRRNGDRLSKTNDSKMFLKQSKRYQELDHQVESCLHLKYSNYSRL
jgi:hypothetical protein